MLKKNKHSLIDKQDKESKTSKSIDTCNFGRLIIIGNEIA